MAKIIENVFDYFKEHNESRYDNYDFLDFLDKIKFSFTKKFIHVTGTNGKGSVCNYLNNIYQKAGYKVGLFNSPFCEKENECILIDNVQISDEKMQEIYQKRAKEIAKFDLSSFEVLTYIMLQYFEESDIDLAIIEVGMGGEFDATNIEETPVLAIINNVGIEHADVLGKSVSEIAYSKCGIIKYGCDVIGNILTDDAKQVLEEVCKENKAKIHYVNEFYRYGISKEGKLYVGYYPYQDFVVNTAAITQRENVACAIEALLVLKEQFPVTQEQIQAGFLCDALPGRFTVLTKGNKILIIDGAHNPNGMESLVKSLDYIRGGIKIDAIVGVFRDKNIEKMLALLGPHVNSITLTTFDHPRARTKEEFVLFLEEYQFVEDYMELINKYIEEEDPKYILVTGSLYFANMLVNKLKGEYGTL